MMDLKDLGGLLRQAKDLQEKIESAQREIAALEVEGAAGGGMVKVRLSGAKRVRAVEIDPEALADRKMLGDLIAAALTDALEKFDNSAREKMQAAAPFSSAMLPLLAAGGRGGGRD